MGNNAPHTEPAVSRKLMFTGEAVPGTPSMRALPAYSTRPPGVCTSMSHSVPVFLRQHAQRRDLAARRHHAALDRERHHRRQHVAAVGRGVDQRLAQSTPARTGPFDVDAV